MISTRVVGLHTWLKRFARSFLHRPSDPYLLLASPGKGWRHLHLRQNYRILRKTAEDHAAWNDYAAF